MDLLSTGNLCQIVQRSPQAIARELEAAGIAPALILNDVRYFEADKAIAALQGKMRRIERRTKRTTTATAGT